MKRVLRSLALVAIAVVSLNAAKAQNPHFVSGSFVWSYGTFTVTASGKIVGIGNIEKMPLGDVRISQEYNIRFNCTNPGGQKPTPWQNVRALAEASVIVTPDRNGQYTFSNLTADIEPIINYNKPMWKAKFCPSAKWNINVVEATPVTARPKIEWNYMEVLD